MLDDTAKEFGRYQNLIRSKNGPGACDIAHNLRRCPESPDLRFDFVVPII